MPARLTTINALRQVYGRLLPSMLESMGEPTKEDIDQRLIDCGYVTFNGKARITEAGWQALHKQSESHTCPECGGFMKNAGSRRCASCKTRRNKRKMEAHT